MTYREKLAFVDSLVYRPKQSRHAYRVYRLLEKRAALSRGVNGAPGRQRQVLPPEDTAAPQQPAQQQTAQQQPAQQQSEPQKAAPQQKTRKTSPGSGGMTGATKVIAKSTAGVGSPPKNTPKPAHQIKDVSHRGGGPPPRNKKPPEKSWMSKSLSKGREGLSKGWDAVSSPFSAERAKEVTRGGGSSAEKKMERHGIHRTSQRGDPGAEQRRSGSNRANASSPIGRRGGTMTHFKVNNPARGANFRGQRPLEGGAAAMPNKDTPQPTAEEGGMPQFSGLERMLSRYGPSTGALNTMERVNNVAKLPFTGAGAAGSTLGNLAAAPFRSAMGMYDGLGQAATGAGQIGMGALRTVGSPFMAAGNTLAGIGGGAAGFLGGMMPGGRSPIESASHYGGAGYNMFPDGSDNLIAGPQQAVKGVGNVLGGAYNTAAAPLRAAHQVAQPGMEFAGDAYNALKPGVVGGYNAISKLF